MIGRVSVMSVQNKPSERMDSSQWGRTYIRLRKKIKNKPTSLKNVNQIKSLLRKGSYRNRKIALKNYRRRFLQISAATAAVSIPPRRTWALDYPAFAAGAHEGGRTRSPLGTIGRASERQN
jgi:hypothetical protein